MRCRDPDGSEAFDEVVGAVAVGGGAAEFDVAVFVAGCDDGVMDSWVVMCEDGRWWG